jgi:predicted metal-dependent phosphoesterase TrpH
MHSLHSDGQYNIEDLILKIRANGIKYFSITDHDSVDSIKEIKKININDLVYIKGVEISSILDEKYKLHILGYFIDENNYKLNYILEKLKEARKKRFIELVNYLEDNYNIKLDNTEIESIVNTVSIPGKPHLAELLIKYGYVSSVEEAFQKYLEKAKTITSNRISADIVIDAIKDAGGLVIWAHPKKVESKYNIDFKNLMPRLLELGLDGIEIFNSLHSFDDCMRYIRYANNNNLIKTGGSDYHGEIVKPKVKLGVVYNSDENKKIDISNIDILKTGGNNGK